MPVSELTPEESSAFIDECLAAYSERQATPRVIFELLQSELDSFYQTQCDVTAWSWESTAAICRQNGHTFEIDGESRAICVVCGCGDNSYYPGGHTGN